jgi:hypothetical protein
MKASEINFDQLLYFSKSEWPENTLDCMDANIIYTLADVREALPESHGFYPSPVTRAHVRIRGSSRHSINEGLRLSDATDFFVEWKYAWDAWNEILRNPEIGGAGIYTDMMFKGTEGDYCMFHIDTRPQRIVWMSWREDRHHKNKYVYLTRDPLEYHRLLAGRGKLS